MAEVVVGQAEFLRPEEERDRGGGSLRRISRAPYSSRRRGCCSSRCPTEVVPTTSSQSATASATEGCSSAVWRRGARPDGGAGLAEGDVVGIDHPEAREAEIGHGAGGRADIERITGLDKDDPEVFFAVGCDDSMVA